MESLYYIRLKIRGLYFLKLENRVRKVKDPTRRSALAVSQNLTFKEVQYIFSAVKVKVTNDRLTLALST